MSSTKEKVEYHTSQMAGAGDIRFRAMFGEYGIYCDEKFVAVVCDNHLFVKITEISEKYLDKSHQAEPYPGAKNYLKIPENKASNKKWLSEFIRMTAEHIPEKKAKR